MFILLFTLKSLSFSMENPNELNVLYNRNVKKKKIGYQNRIIDISRLNRCLGVIWTYVQHYKPVLPIAIIGKIISKSALSLPILLTV